MTTYPMQNIRVPPATVCQFYSTRNDDFNGGEPFLVEDNTETVLAVIPAMSFKRIGLGGQMVAYATTTTTLITVRIYGSVDGVHHGTDALVATGFPASADPALTDGTYITAFNSGEVWAPYYIVVAYARGAAERGLLALDIALTNL